MVFQCEVPQPEVDQACEERETALGCALEGWEREIIKAFLTIEKLLKRQLLLRRGFRDSNLFQIFQLPSLTSPSR